MIGQKIIEEKRRKTKKKLFCSGNRICNGLVRLKLVATLHWLCHWNDTNGFGDPSSGFPDQGCLFLYLSGSEIGSGRVENVARVTKNIKLGATGDERETEDTAFY